MANYNATIRTNYFSVTNESAFRDLIQSVQAEDTVHLFEDPQPDGGKKFGFGCYGYIYGIPITEDEDEYDMDRFFENLQVLLCESDAIILTEIGNEKLRYLFGMSVIITKKAIRSTTITDCALIIAQEMLENDEFTTKMEY